MSSHSHSLGPPGMPPTCFGRCCCRCWLVGMGWGVWHQWTPATTTFHPKTYNHPNIPAARALCYSSGPRRCRRKKPPGGRCPARWPSGRSGRRGRCRRWRGCATTSCGLGWGWDWGKGFKTMFSLWNTGCIHAHMFINTVPCKPNKKYRTSQTKKIYDTHRSTSRHWTVLTHHLRPREPPKMTMSCRLGCT